MKLLTQSKKKFFSSNVWKQKLKEHNINTQKWNSRITIQGSKWQPFITYGAVFSKFLRPSWLHKKSLKTQLHCTKLLRIKLSAKNLINDPLILRLYFQFFHVTLFLSPTSLILKIWGKTATRHIIPHPSAHQN